MRKALKSFFNKNSSVLILKNESELISKSKMGINHIKNMLDENLKNEIEKIEKTSIIEKTDRVYKPTYTIEFNREGEVLLYSCDTFKHLTVYLKYPYVLYEACIPAALYMYLMNPLDLQWYWNNVNFIIMASFGYPRMMYWRSLNYRVNKISLLRGGKVAKIERQSLAGDRYCDWVENMYIHPLTQDLKNFDDRDNASFLEEEGQLKYELGVQLDHFMEMGVTAQDTVLYFLKNGTVHHPELFEAVAKGYNIDTSDFVINTANNLRAREGNDNH